MKLDKSMAAVAAVAIIGALLGTYAGSRRIENTPAPAAVPGSNPGESLFNQQWANINGENRKLAGLRGKILVVNFWATWCPPCVKEIPELVKLQSSLETGKIEIVGIGIDSEENIRRFAAQYHINYPLFAAGSDGVQISRDLGNEAGGLPFTVVLDAQGKIKKTYVGIKIDELRQDLTRL